jgi:hypothetical protein
MKATPLLAVLALSSIALTGCASTASSDGVTGEDGYVPGAPAVDGGGTAGSPDGLPSTPDESVITNAYVYLTGDQPATVADGVVGRAKAASGKIDGRSSSSDAEGVVVAVSLTVRVPADAVDNFLDGLDDIATVHSLSQNSTDVTLLITDYEARISALETSIDRFLALEKSATTVQELIEIETAMADRQAQLEQIQAEMRYYSDQIALSTIQVEIGLPASATDPVPDDFWGGVVAGWKAMLAFLGGIVVAAGVALPWIPLVGAVSWLGLWGWRRMATRRSTKR